MDNRHQILSLTGGGYRGVFTASFLAHCESEWQVDWRSRFQLFAGSSVGALIASGLAAGRTASELIAAMKKHGPTIFAPRFLGGPRRLFGTAPYRTETLKAVAEEVLGSQKNVLLSDFTGNLIVTAVNYSEGRTVLFPSKGLAGFAAPRIKLVDAILASAAAPTYFPMVKIGDHEHADGGLVANAPDLVALIESMGRQRIDVDRSYMLSIGTANWSNGTALRSRPDRPGIIRSLWGRRLVQTTMSAQESLALQQIQVLMRDRHVRVDREPDAQRAKEIRSLDNAGPKAFAALVHVADEEWRAWQDRQRLQGDHRLRDFFAR